MKRKYILILKDFLKIAANVCNFPSNLSPTCSHYSSVAKIIYMSVELRD